MHKYQQIQTAHFRLRFSEKVDEPSPASEHTSGDTKINPGKVRTLLAQRQNCPRNSLRILCNYTSTSITSSADVDMKTIICQSAFENRESDQLFSEMNVSFRPHLCSYCS